MEDAKSSPGQGRRREVVAACIELLTVLSKEAANEGSSSRPFLTHGRVESVNDGIVAEPTKRAGSEAFAECTNWAEGIERDREAL